MVAYPVSRKERESIPWDLVISCRMSANAEYAGNPHYFYGQHAAHALWQQGGDSGNHGISR